MDGKRVLIFPPNRRDGEVTASLLRRAGLTCHVCNTAAALAEGIDAGAGALVLTDAALSAPDFDQVLEAIARQPHWSDLPIVLLYQAGAQSPAAVRIIASLTNVTLLDRPTSARTLVSAAQAAIRARLRQYQTREQLEALRKAEEAVRARERQLETLAENTPDVLIRFERGLRPVFVNQAAARATGRAPPDLIGRTLHELCMPPSVCDLLEHALRDVFGSARNRAVDFALTGPEGLRHYSCLLVSELDVSGKVETVPCVAHDITDSRDAEEKLRSADRRKDEFLAMLAHELRNPLAPIRNASELLSRTLPPEPRLQASISIVKRQITHLSRLVDDLLDVSRITQGRIELQRRPVDLSYVIAQAMESVEPLMREKRHKVFVAASYRPLLVNGDSARLVQCLANILTNSAKYTDDGGEIRVETREEAGSALIVLTDNGVGISPELLPQIFDLFVQSARSLDRSQGGLGIGLSVVKRLIEMHGGNVTAHSEGPGRGARFEVRLPLVAAPHANADEEPEHSVSPRRILVVDDNVDAANSMALLLQLDGHTVECVYSPAEAIERARTFDPQIILLDIGLPGMDGYEVARRIRAHGSGARIVALTGYGQAEDVQRALDAGFDAHLVKPVDLQLLKRKVTDRDGNSLKDGAQSKSH